MEAHLEIYGGKTTKIERYKWKLKDEPGKLRLILKDKLSVDESYQREWNEKKILSLAREWSYIGCGALIVGNRSDGFYIIDGQHRWQAAMRRSDITQLPCIVFDTESNEQEARGFLDANTNRKTLTSIEKFNAMLISGDQIALGVKKILDDSGYVAKKSDQKLGGIRGITVLLRN